MVKMVKIKRCIDGDRLLRLWRISAFGELKVKSEVSATNASVQIEETNSS